MRPIIVLDIDKIPRAQQQSAINIICHMSMLNMDLSKANNLQQLVA